MGIPHTGGTYSVFKNLRLGLLKHGIELRWIGIGAEQAKRLINGFFDSELQFGTVVAPDESEDKRQGVALVEFFNERNFEGVFINALCGRVSTNFVRYLNKNIPRIMVVHSITVGTYVAARAVRDYVHATVGVSPRTANDLIEYKDFDRRWTVSIPNAIRTERFRLERKHNGNGLLQVLFLGRIEDGAKGCFLLPKIISHVQSSGAYVEWRIAGDGPDLTELKQRCKNFSNVQFLGRIPYENVPKVLAPADIYIFTSRYEGFGISLVEAMAAGCVPVASTIRGVTDSIVEHGKTGYLFNIGDWKTAGEHIIRLSHESAIVKDVSDAAGKSVQSRFSIDTVAGQYHRMMEKVLANPKPLKPTLDINRWRYPMGLRPGLRTYLPKSIKIRLRTLRESIHWGTT